VHLERGTKPLRLGNDAEAFKGVVELKFSGESFRSGAVALSIVDNWDKANTDAHVATLR